MGSSTKGRFGGKLCGPEAKENNGEGLVNLHASEAPLDATLERNADARACRAHPVDTHHSWALLTRTTRPVAHEQSRRTSRTTRQTGSAPAGTPCTSRGCWGTRYTHPRCTHCRHPPDKPELLARAPCTAARPARTRRRPEASCVRRTFPALGNISALHLTHDPLHFSRFASHEMCPLAQFESVPCRARCWRRAARRAHLPKATRKHVTTAPAPQPAAYADNHKPVTATATTRDTSATTAIGAKKDAVLIDRYHGSRSCSGVSRRFARADRATTTGAAPATR